MDLEAEIKQLQDQAPLDEALAGLKRIADAQGTFTLTWRADSIGAVADILAAWCRDRRAQLADAHAQIARLQAELDAREDSTVEYVMERHLEHAMAADPDRADRTILRCTDNPSRSVRWRAAAREWEPLP